MDTYIKIYVMLKHIGNVTKSVKKHPFLLSRRPTTLGELVEESVKTCIAAYNARAIAANTPTPLDDEQFEEYKEIGKFAFGVHYNRNEVNQAEAINVAKAAVSDGLVRIFRGKEKITGLDTKLQVCDGDEFTFIRLTMLSGITW